MRHHRWQSLLILIATAFVVYFAGVRDAQAIPSFARKYKTTCTTCHTIFPVLNSYGEAFRRNGYRLPSKNGSVDSDAIDVDDTVPQGSDAYKKVFPMAVWPDKIMKAVPLSAMLNGGVAFNMPNTDAHDANGNTFTWDGVLNEWHFFGAGAFDDKLTYFSEVTLSAEGVSLEHGVFLWNDAFGPAHMFNFWVGRLLNPQITSFGTHSSYLVDTQLPGTSASGMMNPNHSFVLGVGKSDGIEMNGIVGHRLGYALGYIASGTMGGLKMPNAQDMYAHIGAKLGGMSLDGEGDVPAQNAERPWEETSLTLDLFAYRGLSRIDNGTSADAPALPIPQDDIFGAFGGAMRIYFGSLQISSGILVEKHSRPFAGTAGTPAAADGSTPAIPGVPSLNKSTALTQYNEINYILYPWLVPGIRSEYTRIDLDNGDKASLVRIIPGVAFLARPNIKIVVTADYERALGNPAGGFGPAQGQITSVSPLTGKKNELEQVNIFYAWAF